MVILRSFARSRDADEAEAGDPSISPSASVAECHSREFLAESLRFRWIFGLLKTVGELKKRRSPSLIGQDRIRQQIDDRAIPANMAARGDSVNFLSQLGGKRNASPDAIRCCKSRTHISPEYTKIHHRVQNLILPSLPL